MATRLFSRSFLFTKTLTTTLLPRSLPLLSPSPAAARPLSLLRALRSLAAASNLHLTPSLTIRSFATRTTASSLNDPSPNWSNRPPKETILLDGCDFEHWLVVMEKPEGEPTRDEIIDSYIKTLAMVVGSEEEARMKIYSVSTRCYFAFGALVSEELSYKIKELPRVRWVLPDSYLDVRNKDYGGEPFINGQAVPYDPKYHEEWIRNNARANERNKRNSDRPRNFDRSRNYERRRENMQRNMQAPNQGPPNNYANAPQPSGPPPPQQNNYNAGPPPQQNYNAALPPQQNNYNAGPPPQQNYNAAPPPQQNYNAAPPPQQNYNAAPPPQQNYNPAPPPQQNYNPGPPPQYNYNPVPPPQQNNYPAGPPSQQNFQNVPNNGNNYRG